MTTDKIYISWEDFHQHVKQLCKKINSTGEYTQIIAVSRGGLIPAGIISYELNIRNSGTINVSSYDDFYNRRPDEAIELSTDVKAIDGKTLIVDDLADTGRTFNILRRKFPSAQYVSVYSKPQGAASVDIVGALMPDEWIVFPWDV